MSNNAKHNERPVTRQEFNLLNGRVAALEFQANPTPPVITERIVYVQPNTQAYETMVLDSAKANVNNALVEDNDGLEDGSDLEELVIEKCKQAIRRHNTLSQLNESLAQSLNDNIQINQFNQYLDWDVFVSPKGTCYYDTTNYVYRLDVNFGQLDILLMAHFKP